MSEELLIRHCAPTLAGLKAANMFSCKYETEEELRAYLRNINNNLAGKGIRALPLKVGDNRALIYLFRPYALQRILSSGEAKTLLKEKGYMNECAGCHQCHVGMGGYLCRLAGRIKSEKDFPHEIGIFLDYPPEEVRAFMECDPARCKCTGVWKVFCDEEKSKKAFAMFDKCRHIYAKLYSEGYSIDKLTVKERRVNERRGKQ